MLREEKSTEMNKLIRRVKIRFHVIESGHFGGEYDKTLKYIERAEELIKRFQGDIPEEIKPYHILWLWFKALTYAYKGDLARSLKDAKEVLMVAQLYDNKRGISMGTHVLGEYHRLSGDLNTALVHFDRAIRLSEEHLNDFRDFNFFAGCLLVATRASIDNEDLERAKKYFKRLEEIKELKPEELWINDPYHLAKAYLLKLSRRSRDRIMAEDLLRELIEEDLSFIMYRLFSLSELCELSLVELRVSNDINLISEIKLLLEKLIAMARHSGLYYWLIEAYILHGKLALIMFDIESSRSYLTKAQSMAKNHGFIALADEIAGLWETIMEKKDKWEQMEKRNAPISERMDLARLDDHLKGKFRMRMMKMERVADRPPKKDVF